MTNPLFEAVDVVEFTPNTLGFSTYSKISYRCVDDPFTFKPIELLAIFVHSQLGDSRRTEVYIKGVEEGRGLSKYNGS